MIAVESDSRSSDLIDLDRALARLSPVTRTVVWLYDVEGWSHEEIARSFERTVSFSKSQLARGHARLRDESERAGCPRRAHRSGVSSMDTDMTIDSGIGARLRRLDTYTAEPAAPFGYDTLMDRHAGRQARTRRRRNFARGAAGALVLALVGASVWRLDQEGVAPVTTFRPTPTVSAAPQPRIVRADTYLAVAALEDHIASRRRRAQRGADVFAAAAPRSRDWSARRNDLLDSYARVRYAEMVSANF